MTVVNDNQIADMAEMACFYVDPSGKWLRMDFCDMESGFFQCHDEESFEEYAINFDDVTLEGKEKFYELTEMTLPSA